MRCASRFCVFVFVLLAGCSGGGTTVGSVPAQTENAPSVMQKQDQTPREVLSDAMRAPLAVPLSGSSDLLYVGNTGNNSITVYRHDAQGNTAPLAVIAGSKTGITDPGQLSEDGSGNLYVANNDALLVFAHGANGNVAPIRRLAGPLTGIHQISAMTVDKLTGKLFIGDYIPESEPFDDPILRFPPNANGNTAPFARSSAVMFAGSFASDSTGNNLIVTGATGPENHEQVVGIFAKQFANGTSPGSFGGISTVTARGVADDPTTKTYLVIGSDGVGSQSGIIRFAENTVGYGEDRDHPASFKPAIVSAITSDTCGSNLAVAPGPTPNTYVTHAKAACPADAVYVYPNNANGNAKPLRILSGSLTKLSTPYGIYEGL